VAIFLFLIGGGVWTFALWLTSKAVKSRDVFSFTVAIDCFTAGAIVIGCGCIVLAIQNLQRAQFFIAGKQEPKPTPDALG
jgi:hypothetical protein